MSRKAAKTEEGRDQMKLQQLENCPTKESAMTKTELHAVPNNSTEEMVSTPKLNETSTTTPDMDSLPLNPTASAPDPFDMDSLRIDQSFIEKAGVKKLLTTVLVGKPNPQDFVRVHPDPAYRETYAMVELKEDREFFILHPDIARLLPGEFFMATVFTCINRQGVVRLFPVRLPSSDGKRSIWHQSLMEAAQHAMHRWVRIKANMSLGAYEMFEAGAPIPDPVWPEVTFRHLLRLGFRDNVALQLDHPLVKRLRGLG
jgi:hypothetical protein